MIRRARWPPWTCADDAVRVLGDGDAGCVVVAPTEPLTVVRIPAVKRR